ncbi:ABC transporter ATP-binding protein [Candidatus Poribacteria bacterium]|nr:ABC transporter ATP-binding protein [Candidatus Poribacteria bacterium]
MIEVENLTKLYGPTLSLDNVSFTVPEGEILGFLGPNGAGKTTTMRILTGLTRATSGRARIAGLDTERDNTAIRRLIGYLPEESPLYDEMTPETYLRFMAGMKELPSRTVPAQVDRVLDETHLSEHRKRLIGNLSKGTRQRVGIAQSLLGDPRVLILDEPTSGLDPAQTNEVRLLIAGMRGKRTVIFSTHILPNVAITCTRVVILNRGRSIAQGAPAEIGRGSAGRELALRVRSTEAAARAALEPLLRPIESTAIEARKEADDLLLTVRWHGEDDIRPSAARAFVEAGIELLEMREVHASLEDVFLRAISEQAPEQEGR